MELTTGEVSETRGCRSFPATKANRLVSIKEGEPYALLRVIEVKQTTRDKEVRPMKLRRSQVRRQVHAIPVLKFQNQSLTSFAGLILFQQFFVTLRLKARLRTCFRHRVAGKKLSRHRDHRKALFKNLIKSLVLHGEVKTTESKAKAVRPLVEKLITKGKAGTLHARRLI